MRDLEPGREAVGNPASTFVSGVRSRLGRSVRGRVYDRTLVAPLPPASSQGERGAGLGAVGRWVPILGLAAGGAFLSLALRDVPWQELRRLLATGDWGLALPMILLGVAVFLIAKARRWRALLGDPAGIGTSALVRPVAIGVLLNALLAHSGEFARAIALNRRFGLSSSGVLAGIAVERLFDFLVVLAFGFLAGAVTDIPPALRGPLHFVSVFALGLGIGVALALVSPRLLQRLVAAFSRYLPARAGRWIELEVGQALDGLAPLRRAHGMTSALLWSLIQWGAIVWCVYFCARVPGVVLTLPMAALVLIGIVVVFTLPSAPGYLGSTQVAFLAVLVPLGIAKAPALAASFVYTLAVVVPLMLSGMIALAIPAGAGGGARS